MSYKSFPNSQALGEWMAHNHANATELWVRIYKSASGKPTVTWTGCVVEAIRFGWIDGQKKPLDEESFCRGYRHVILDPTGLARTANTLRS
jgi:uncharacterized protein YdeI (YjbR/CyaY-like superfamily)